MSTAAAKNHQQQWLTLSVVSHGQVELVADLLNDLGRHRRDGIEVILTLNTDESLPFDAGSFPFLMSVIRNVSPKGFAANHNAAFHRAQGAYFCVINPDIRLEADPFPALVEELQDATVGVVAPLITDSAGTIEDSARPFPTILDMLRKAVGLAPSQYYEIDEKSFSPDWVGGMFMVFRRQVFSDIGGFDAAYHLYYEDVDLCARLRLAGYDVRLVPHARAIHIARRQSRRDAKHFLWHLQSMLRFFLSEAPRAARKAVARQK